MQEILLTIFLISTSMIISGIAFFVWTKEWHEHTQPTIHGINSYMDGKTFLILIGSLSLFLGLTGLFG